MGGINLKEVIGVRFKKPGKIYFFDPKNCKVKKGQHVIVETSMGQEFAEVLIENKMIPEEKIPNEIKPILRVAGYKDYKRNEENKQKEKEAFKICEEQIKKHNLAMNLTEVEYKFDNSKILFYFTADGRIDFRELVKDLAGIFKTRIELRQIGVRDEVKRIGGNGMCGRQLCCTTFLPNFETVSIKMAKEQNISLNPSKISGNCGRLMCCLKYEEEAYLDKLKKLPKVGAIVKAEEDGEGVVDSVEILKEKIRVKFKDKDGFYYKKFDVKDLTIIKDVEDKDDIDGVDKDDLKELRKLEKLEEEDKNNRQEDDI
jgi:cell fate regulator YaaT (PSP1 superfamily)